MIQNSHDIAQFRSKYKLNSKFQDFWYKFFIKIYKLIYYNCQNELNTKWYILSFCYTLFKQKLSTHFYLKKKKKSHQFILTKNKIILLNKEESSIK